MNIPVTQILERRKSFRYFTFQLALKRASYLKQQNQVKRQKKSSKCSKGKRVYKS